MLGSNSCQRLQLLLPSCRNVGGSLTHLHFFQKEPIFFSSYSSKSSLVSGNDKLQEKVISFTVSYLINSRGLSPKLALSASKSVQFDNREGPDSVLNVLRNHGFSDDHISQLVRKRPKLLSANAEKTVVPKLEFLSSVGLSGTGLFRVLYSNPNIILKNSLERTIIPCYDIIKSLLLVDEKVALFLRSSYWVMTSKLINMVPNISVLRALEVPQASISLWVTCQCPLILRSSRKISRRSRVWDSPLHLRDS
ncbi:PREDICTED: mRNAion termination factor [Prunus dulcis]|uniref:PREDICTED: mRNAion termination factor n=1 Tax=Prunus dulcis TaxID=3755 RepID=A0A5E4FBR9_PRUDU|nr:PREDICTED: mRNAion termination factor [Prunus dulcis]